VGAYNVDEIDTSFDCSHHLATIKMKLEIGTKIREIPAYMPLYYNFFTSQHMIGFIKHLKYREI